MESLLWHLANRTAETEFIFNLFHLLLAGLTLLVLLHQFRANRESETRDVQLLPAAGFFLIVFHFALRTLYFGGQFFFRMEWRWAGLESISHALFVCGLLIVVAGYREGGLQREARVRSWVLGTCGMVGVLALADVLLASPQRVSEVRPHSVPILLMDMIAFVGASMGVRMALRGLREARTAVVVALSSVGATVLLHAALFFLPRTETVFLWNTEQHLLSASLFAFAWAVGERSRNLLDRVFVRLNLTFIILASLIMLFTAGMEKYQYLRLAEERSMNLAEFLRGHIVYYHNRGISLEEIFHNREVLRRVVVEFGTLPELRQINVYLEGQRATYRYTDDWEVREEFTRGSASPPIDFTNSFQMIRLPIESATTADGVIEFMGTMDHINEYIGKYIILIYTVFTVVVGLATGIIGIIVTNADRRLRQQYAELQETQQQLAHAAKLASTGELAGGMAHEINNPITSILSLASHMTEDKSGRDLSPRYRKNLQLISKQAERVSRIVRDLLAFGRQSRFELSRVNIKDVLETATNLVQYRLRDRGIELKKEVNGNLPIILGDANRLNEVLVNLLNNAIDAMPGGGTLVVRARKDFEAEGGVCLEVEDTGCGIAPEHLSRIFDPFFTTKEPGRGTGLGLSISHGIIKDHGGQIWARSRLKQGTTVVISLPRGGSSL